jgi:hypothetical protein
MRRMPIKFASLACFRHWKPCQSGLVSANNVLARNSKMAIVRQSHIERAGSFGVGQSERRKQRMSVANQPCGDDFWLEPT